MVDAFTVRAKESTVPGKIAVEVAYALPEKQYLQRVSLEEGATIEQAIVAFCLLELSTDIDLSRNKVAFIVARQNCKTVLLMVTVSKFIAR